MSSEGGSDLQRASTLPVVKKPQEERRNTVSTSSFSHKIPHKIFPKKLVTPATCTNCHKFIWGLMKTALVCEECNSHWHEDCKVFIQEDCGLTYDLLTRAMTLSNFNTNEAVSRSPSPSEKKKDKPEKNVVMVNDHIFKLYTYKSPTWCNTCGKFIWGFSKQGWKCTKCELDCHGDCKSNSPPCVNVKLKGGELTVNQDPKQSKITQESMSKINQRRTEADRKKAFTKTVDFRLDTKNSIIAGMLRSSFLIVPDAAVTAKESKESASTETSNEEQSRNSMDSKESEIEEVKHPLVQDTDFVSKLEKSESFRDAFDSGQEAKKRRDSEDTSSIDDISKAQLTYDDFEILDKEVLGRGQFGIVKKAKYKKTSKTVAVKIIDKRKFWGRKQGLKNMKREIAILSSLRHPGVIELYAVSDFQNDLYLFMELIEGGDLLGYVEKQGHLKEDESKFLFHQMCVGVKYLHDNGIIHRDLKPENLLLLEEDGVKRIKIADFGFANIVGETSFLQSVVGTPAYLAPEMLKSKGYQKSADMWSIGVIMYACMSGVFPFDENEPVEDQIKQGKFSFPNEYWKDVSNEAIDLILHLLVPNPKERFTIDQVLQHPWFSTYSQLNL